MIEEFSFLGFPLCAREVRKVAYDFTEANGFEGFSKQSNEAGRKWFAFLLKRYPKLKVKEGVTNLSIAKAKASNRNSVTRWYKKYQNVLNQLEITDPRYIWNIDEHGSEDMAKVKKVIGLKGIKQFQKQPHEKPKCTTMLTYVNAAGFALPPLVIHKGKYHDSWRTSCPRQVMVRGSKKATSTSSSLLNMERGSFTICMLLGNWINQTWSWWTATTLMFSIIVTWKWCSIRTSK